MLGSVVDAVDMRAAGRLFSGGSRLANAPAFCLSPGLSSSSAADPASLRLTGIVAA